MADIRKTEKWPADVNGYAICPACGCMVHMRYKKVHLDACYGVATWKHIRPTQAPTDGGTDGE